MFLLGLLILIFVESAVSKSLPSFIHRCSKSDPDLNSCLAKSSVDALQKIKHGYRELGIVPLEPFFIKKIDLGNNTAGAVSLHPTYENMYFYGISNVTLTDTDANLTGDNCYWNWKTYQPILRMESDYTMTGHMLVFPINGHGKCNNTLYEVTGNYRTKCERYKKKNQTFLRTISFEFDMTPRKVIFDFENIIDGNEQLSKEVLKTANENADALYADFGPAFNKALETVWKEVVNQIFRKVPEDELFLP